MTELQIVSIGKLNSEFVDEKDLKRKGRLNRKSFNNNQCNLRTLKLSKLVKRLMIICN
jgi:hypothetical protein